MSLWLICSETNDLLTVLRSNGVAFVRSDAALRSVELARPGDGVAVLADGYPEQPLALNEDVFDAAARKQVRVYAEFPAALPGLCVGAPRGVQWERTVVASEAFAPVVSPGRILMIHGCRFVPVATRPAHLVAARVAGFDTAVYGLPAEQFPLLFEHTPNVLVAATKLSQFVTARYAPLEAWQTIWTWIIRWLGGNQELPRLAWQPTVRPSASADAPLRSDAEQEALRRGEAWYRNARLFVHPSWRDEALRRYSDFGDRTAPGPDPAWPCGDGSCGILEGAHSRVNADGTQDWRYYLRTDCAAESAMALALSALVTGNTVNGSVASNLNDFIFAHSPIAQGPRADPASPSYGLLSFSTAAPYTEIYYGDDNARSLLGVLCTAAILKVHRWDECVMRCLLGNLRTTGPLGFRGCTLNESDLQSHGWQHYWTAERVNYAPHYECWLWACFLLVHRHTGFGPFNERAQSALGMTVAAYPDQWKWTNGIQQERARMLLPLAWLVRAHDTPEHRRWLRRVAEDLIRRQDVCGAIREELGDLRQGRYPPPISNERYGVDEAPLLQQNGDPLCDLLYCAGFAFLGLHEAAAATGEAFYADAEDRLARFLCRIQVRSERHPELDGAWFRAFDFRRWEYWASNADHGWGAWSAEAGWSHSWIMATLALRQIRRSLWDILTGARLVGDFASLAEAMLPSDPA